MGYFPHAQYNWNGIHPSRLEAEAAEDDKPGWTAADRRAYQCPECGEDGDHCEHPWCTGRTTPSDNN